MGLAERQMMAKMKEEWLPGYKSKLDAAAGFPIEIAIDDASFTTIDSINGLAGSFFSRFTDDVKSVCADKLGKEALKESLKKVMIKYTAEKKSFKNELDGGVFTATGKWDGSIGDDCPGAGAYKEFLMSKL